jgi:DNA-binding XRE family transcriptional regulator
MKQRLGNRLRQARAKLTGISHQTTSSIETCLYVPSARLAFIIAQKLEKPLEEPFFLEGDDA